MVRNPRLVMMCGVVAVALGVALGSRPVSAPADEPSPQTLLGLLVPGAALWAQLGAQALPEPRRPVVQPAEVASVAPFDPGARSPRQPRQSRDASARDSR